MAQKDYVARSQKKRKPPVRKKAKHNVAWFKVVLAIAVVAAFVAGLWYLKDMDVDDSKATDTVVESAGATTSENETVSNTHTNANTDSDEKETLPEMGEEEWEFIEGLPEYSVEVEVGEMPGADKRYLMQCGSFRERTQAEELKAKIAFQGYESEVRRTVGKNGVWFRVILGPIQPKRKAERIRHDLRGGGVNRCVVWEWNLD